MVSLHDLLDRLIAREGGYADDPDDRGGATKYGITLQTLRDWRGDQSLTFKDMQVLGEHEAREIYTERYYKPGKITQLPDRLQELVFDACVISGTGNAWRALQAALNDQGGGLKVDGAPGVKTFAAVASCDIEKCRKDYLWHRVLFHDADVIRNPKQGKFLRGWHRRLKELA